LRFRENHSFHSEILYKRVVPSPGFDGMHGSRVVQDAFQKRIVLLSCQFAEQ